MNAEALVVDSLCKNFGQLEVVREISFSIAPEERRVVIIGPNGAGKTTLFNLISGELAPSGGRMRLFGLDITQMPCYKRTRLGLARTFQITDLFPYFTVEQNLLLALQAHDRCAYQMIRPVRTYHRLYDKAKKLLTEMNLWDKRHLPVTDLSHGDMRLIEILMGIAGGPRILLLDEPTAGLTRSEGEWLARVIGDMLKNVTLLIIEHDMNIAFSLAERIIVLHQGAILADGVPEDIRANPKIREIYLGQAG